MAFGFGWGGLMFVTGRSSISPLSGPGYEHIQKSGETSQDKQATIL